LHQVFHRGQPLLLQPLPSRRRERRLLDVGQRRAAPQGDCRGEQPLRCRRVTLPQGSASAGGKLPEPPHVHAFRRNIQQIGSWPAHDSRISHAGGIQDVAQPVDVGLQGGFRCGGRLLPPQVADQLCRGDGPAGVKGKIGQHGPLPGTA